MKSQITAWSVLALTLMAGVALGSTFNNQKFVDNTLKMCNQKPNECRFKYDILMYNETGRVPYQNTITIKPVVKK